MSLQTLAQQVVDLCQEVKNFDVMERFYHDDISSVEPDGTPTRGKQAVIDKSKKWAEGVEIHSETVLGPLFHGDHQFATQNTFEITRKATGERETLKEVIVYTVDDQDRITREEFYFGGDQW